MKKHRRTYKRVKESKYGDYIEDIPTFETDVACKYSDEVRKSIKTTKQVEENIDEQIDNINEIVSNQKQQAGFAWLPLLAAGGGLFGGWKLFGGKDEETDPNPVVYYTMLFVFVAVIIAAVILIYKKVSK
ncbi:hypothetical protein FACS1894153_0360 [Bacteroidia bacterium]|nr:hypothetical protein FACS1894153_0360 [Bacteroidia bacterium]